MKHYLKISYINEDERTGNNITCLGIKSKSCPQFKEILIPMTSEDPKEASREYLSLFETLKLFERPEGSSILQHAIMKSLNASKDNE